MCAFRQICMCRSKVLLAWILLNGIDSGIVTRLTGNAFVDYADTQYVTYVDAPRGRTMLSGVDFELWQNRDRSDMASGARRVGAGKWRTTGSCQ